MGKLARSRLKWAGHVERMEGEWLTKRADALRVEGRRRRGRLQFILMNGCLVVGRRPTSKITRTAAISAVLSWVCDSI